VKECILVFCCQAYEKMVRWTIFESKQKITFLRKNKKESIFLTYIDNRYNMTIYR